MSATLTPDATRAVPRSRRLPALRANWIGLSTALALLLLWQLLDATKVLNFTYLPAPSEILSAAKGLWQEGTLQHNLAHTLEVAVLGWALAAVIGAASGFLLALVPVLGDWVLASCEVMRAIPGVTLAPLSVLLFGFSLQMELVLVVYVSLWPVFMAAYVGAHSRDPRRADVARSLRMGRTAQVLKMVAPEAAAELFVSLRLALAVALNLAVLAEIIGNPDGIGAGLTQAQSALQPGKMFAYVIVVGLLGVILNWLLSAAFRTLLPGVAANLDRAEP